MTPQSSQNAEQNRAQNTARAEQNRTQSAAPHPANRPHPADRKLFFVCTLLISIGIVFSLSLPVFEALKYDYSSFHFFVRQFAVGCAGVAIMWALSHMNPDRAITPICFFFFITMFFLMIAMNFMPESLVYKVNGAARWIKLPGLSFAPVEFLKIGFIYFLAWSFARKFNSNKTSTAEDLARIFPYFIVFGIIVFIIAYFQNDLGQVLVLGAVLIMMFLLAGLKFRYFIIGSGLLFCVAVTIIMLNQKRIERMQSWWSGVQDIVLAIFPERMAQAMRIDNIEAPYQVGHSLNAIHNGGVWGQGLGEGMFKLGFLGEVHTDFVLAGITEEIGLVGITVIVFLYYLMLYRIFIIGSRCDGAHSKTQYLFCSGMGFMLLFSFLLNAFGITSLLPLKGIAVPLLSYGGSGLLANCVAIGLILMISKRSNLGKT